MYLWVAGSSSRETQGARRRKKKEEKKQEDGNEEKEGEEKESGKCMRVSKTIVGTEKAKRGGERTAPSPQPSGRES